MILQRISLTNYRNYPAREFLPDARGNLVLGANGSGKTNLLEAISYCGTGRSVRTHHDEELLMFGAAHWSIRAEFLTDSGLSLDLEFTWQQGNKLLRLDGVPVRQLSSIYTRVKTIYCGPQEPLLINGSPRLRRQHFDMSISQLYPGYIQVLRELYQVVAQRNALLKTGYDPKQKQSWDLSLIRANREVLNYRFRYMKLLNEALAAKPGFITDGNQMPVYHYLPSHKCLQELDDKAQLGILSRLESREKHWQRSLLGAHLDDYDFVLDGRSMKSFASQGQKQMAAVSLKLTQAALIQKVTGIMPILLFDDIFAELDSSHSQKVKEFAGAGMQVFVASPKNEVSSIWQELSQLKGFGDVA